MITKIFIDLDGVAADFCEPVFKFFGKRFEEARGRWDLREIFGISNLDLDFLHRDTFWEGLKVCVGAEWLIGKCISRVGIENVAFLSDPMHWRGSANGKRSWVRKHFPGFSERLILTGAKHFLASPDALLIDDRDLNIEKFRAAGGAGILIPRHWNSEFNNADLFMSIFELRLKGVFENAGSCPKNRPE